MRQAHTITRGPIGGCWHRNARTGFTLVEMSLVIMIAGIIAVTVIPAWNSMTGTRQAAAAEEVERKLVAARCRAVAEGRPVGIRVDPTNMTVQAWVITTPGAVPTVALGVDGQPDPVLNIPGVYSGSLITSLAAGDGTTTAQVLWFGYDGSPQLRNSTTGNLIGGWAQDATITMAGSQKVVVRMSTGLVQR